MRITTLGEVADWGSGGTPKRGVAEHFGEGVPWLSIADLNDGVVTRAKESLTPVGIANSSAKVVPAGTLFVAMYGSIGKLGIATRSMCTSQAIAHAKPWPDVVDTQYLFHYLLAQRTALQGAGRGGTQMNIGQADLKAWPIPLPPLPEQRRVAAILGHADALRGKRRQVQSHLETLTQAVFNDMFGQGIGARASLAEVATVSSGITKGRRTSEPTSPIPYLAVSNVQAGHLNLSTVKEIEATETELARFALHPGDLILTEGGDPDKLGRGTIWRGELPACLHQNHIFRVRVAEHGGVRPEYLTAFMAGPEARSYFRRCAKQTTGIASINMTQLKALPFFVPDVRMQDRFIDRARKVESQRAAAQGALIANDELFSSLQSRAFRGEL